MPNRLDNLYGIPATVSSTLVNSQVLITPLTFGFGGPFSLLSFTAFNFDTSTGYMILVFDSATLPANGTVTPVYFAYVGAASSTVPEYVAVQYQYPLMTTNGIVIAGSTTLTTPYTLAVATATKLAFSSQVTV